MSFNHVEAFCLMDYQCEKCRHFETLWNSRDGVTPFAAPCRLCGKWAQHINFKRDLYQPSFKPPKGMRVFIDLTREKAAECAKERARSADGAAYEIKEEIEREEFIDLLAKDIYGNGKQPAVVETP